jgi:cytochrome o ubiquinol oxidase subunit 2
METRLHGVLNETGESEGISANYSGAGFSGMKFKVRSMSDAEFQRWIGMAKASQQSLTRDAYLQLAKPSEREPVRYFASVDKQLYDLVVGMCVEPGKMCMHDMMAIDDRGGLGKAGIYNVARRSNDRPRAVFGSDNSHVIGICAAPLVRTFEDDLLPQVDRSPLRGAGLPRPTPSRSGSLLADTVDATSAR